MTTTMLIAGLTGIIAVVFMFAAFFVNAGAAAPGATSHDVFKTGNPTRTGSASTQGLRQGEVDPALSLEAARLNLPVSEAAKG